MRLLTPAQAVALDQATFQSIPGSSESLARQAGQAVANRLRELAPAGALVLVLIGPGNNGQDGMLAAGYLVQMGFRVRQWRLKEQKKLTAADLGDSDFVIDALFGIGLSRDISGLAQEAIQILNQIRQARKKTPHPLFVLSVDLPSGLDGQTGAPRGISIRADETLTIQAAKPGFYQNKAPSFTGRVRVAKLDYPQDLFRQIASDTFACGWAAASHLIPRRPSDANKGSFGVVNLIAGSAKYPGAGVLCARSALRTGVGYLRFIQFEQMYPEWFQIPETLFQKWDYLPRKLDPKMSWVIGPGLEPHKRWLTLLRELLHQGCEQVTLDATALEYVPQLKEKLPATWVLTPHPKELAGLMKTSTQEIQKDRLAAAREASQKFGATVLLKGSKTIVHSGTKSYITLLGNAALAKAGSGDVLSGLIGSLRAQNLSAPAAAVLGALIHGAAANLWVAENEANSMNPSDIIEMIPRAQRQIKSYLGGPR